MKFWDIFLKMIEIITPTFIRNICKNRFDRLKSFFDERKRILESNENEATKTILLNAAASALTGAKSAKIEELNFFLEKFNPNYFEGDYWAFARNRLTYEVTHNQNSEIVSIKSIKSERYKMYVINSIMIFVMGFVPLALYLKGNELKQGYHSITGIPTDFFTLTYWVICFICALTIVKILYDWTCWSDLNNLIKKMFP
ncbi:hypothetical protein KTJ16_19955 [Acinetobacter bereziniae]|jgi:hypothetical protein|uniref:hypothetical protein n=1 Tax=Acinetobacter TaxID=469 RepID=UPI000EF6D936|nr:MULTISPECIES: hypothetical protein [Acinetobacter]MBJ8421659.1 hypothetical protein [Acinetobacter bereziniae]MBO3654549.1 hypothetical protein [Acinetobacter bereziniae]MCU4473318.1 hypothetical protein [Acinetobacter bereziniae]MCU4543435.1 hypothetical protein [Acinetobacter bereziniae]MCU4627602.1 hypothetical protein [Acinetobacter bereziniae]